MAVLVYIARFCVSEIGLIVFYGALICAFLTCVILWAVGALKKEKKWLAFTVFYLGLTVIMLSCCIILNESPALPLAVLGVGITLTFPLALCNDRRERDCKDLIKQIDKEIYSNSERIQYESPIKRDKIEKFTVKEKKAESVCEIDFSHVKNILARLDYFPLSANDKKTVNELEQALIKGEAGEMGVENKSKINDGLSSLLKIMSKYGV